jgi:hypothetical protein
MPNLKSLELTLCQVTDSAWAELPQLKKLDELKLRQTEQTAALDAALKQFPKPPKIIVTSSEP